MVYGITEESFFQIFHALKFFFLFNYFIFRLLKYFKPIEKEYFHSFSTDLLTVYYMPASELHAWDTTEKYLDKSPALWRIYSSRGDRQ